MKIAVAGGTGTVGRHVIEVARERGHETIVLTRSTGHDLTRGDGLDSALDGVDAVIDVTSVLTQSAKVSSQVLGGITSTLLAAEKSAGVGHHILLGIVGSIRAPYDYYAGKKTQEDLVESGVVPWSILRATQFHEFAAQMHERLGMGPFVLAPKFRTRPVAAREVAERLVALAEDGPSGHARELVGPEELRLRDMVKAYDRANGKRSLIIELPLPGGFGKAMRDGTLLGDSAAAQGRQTYDEWLAAL